MPEMDLSAHVHVFEALWADFTEEIDLSEFIIPLKISCYALWPLNAERRATALASAWARLLSRPVLLDDGPPSDSHAPLQRAINRQLEQAVKGYIEESFSMFGGWSAIEPNLCLESPVSKAEVDKAQDQLSIAGQTLAIIRAISEKPNETGSLNKAAHVMTATMGMSRTKIFDAWRSYKTAAHLQIAIVAAFKLTNNEFDWPTILAVAHDFQRFAVGGRHIDADAI